MESIFRSTRFAEHCLTVQNILVMWRRCRDADIGLSAPLSTARKSTPVSTPACRRRAPLQIARHFRSETKPADATDSPAPLASHRIARDPRYSHRWSVPLPPLLSSTERPRRPAHWSGHDCARRLREHHRRLDLRWNSAPGASYAVAAIAVSERALGRAHPPDAPADGPAGGRPPHVAGRPGPLHEDRKHGPRRWLHCKRRRSLLSRPGCRELPLRRFTRRRTGGGGPQRRCAERSRRCRNQAAH